MTKNVTNFWGDLCLLMFQRFNISVLVRFKTCNPLNVGAKIHIFPQKTNVKPENLMISHKFTQKS